MATALTMRHPECDIRPWLKHNEARVDPYTVQRIHQSYSFVEDLLSACEGMGAGSAYDIGCGAGYDTFAIGCYFDHVSAIDRDRRAIQEARLITREAGVSHIVFKRARIESTRHAHPFDFVYCNLMSHNVPSRCAHAGKLSEALSPGAYLLYSEITEGYAPMEIHRAIIGRDRVQLFSRIHQVLRGLTGQSGFRFFLAGSVHPLLEANELQIVASQCHHWNGLKILERVTAKAKAGAPAHVRYCDPDYLCMHADFAEVRLLVKEMLSARPKNGFSIDQRRRVEALLRSDGNRYAPFLTFLLMADFAVPSFRLASSPIGRAIELGKRAGRSLDFACVDRAAGKDLDWGELEDLDLRFIEAMRRRAGMATNAIDD